MRRLRHLAALYPERPWEFFHAVGDNLSQLHYLLAQFGVFRNVALNPVAIGLQLFVQRPEFSDETINFAHRSFRYLAQQSAEMLARHFAIATLGLPLRLDHPVQVCPPNYLVPSPEHRPFKTSRGQSILSEILVSVAAKQQNSA